MMTDQQFIDACDRMYMQYMENVWAYVHRTRIKNPYTGQDSPPDQDLMGKIEQQVGIPEQMVDDYRRDLVVRTARPKPNYKLDDPYLHNLENGIAAVITKDNQPIETFAKESQP